MEYWVKNRSQSDVVSSELNLKIPAGRVVNLAKLNPSLTHEQLQKSEIESGGFLARCFFDQRLVKLPMAPVKQHMQKTSTLTESMKPIPSRVKTSIIIDTNESDFIEELSNFDMDMGSGRYSDGVSDPLMVSGDSGEKFSNKPFQAVVIPAHEDPDADGEVEPPRKLKAKTMKTLGKGFVVMDEPEEGLESQ